jgi:hypothetical protein
MASQPRIQYSSQSVPWEPQIAQEYDKWDILYAEETRNEYKVLIENHKESYHSGNEGIDRSI